jgi:hypothetical protein
MITRPTATLAALAAAALTATLTAGAASAQQADRTPAGGHDLLSRADVAGAFDSAGPVSRHAGAGDGGLGLSPCTGQTRMRDVVGTHDRIFHSIFDGRIGERGARFGVSEQIAGRASAAKAATSYRDIVRQVRDCQTVPEGHWYFGRVHRVSTDTGRAIWMPTFNGDGTRAGGYAVLVDGTHVGVVDVDAPSNPRRVERLTEVALTRLH